MKNKDIGNTLIGTAEIIRGFGIFLSIAASILVIIAGEFGDMEWFINPNILGIGIGIGGLISVWIISITLYGFGVLINTAIDIQSKLADDKPSNEKE